MSMPAPPVTTGSFRSVFHPDQIAQILNLLVGGSPYSNVCSRYPTSRHAVAFPTAKPDRPAWIPEMGSIPIVGLGDDAAIVATCKLASIVLMSNESYADSSVNLTSEFANLMRDSASAALDEGVLYGAGDPEPAGVVAAALPASGADLGAAITAGIGSIGDMGGSASHLCALPSVLAGARDTRDSNGQLVFPNGIGSTYGLAEVGVPQLKAADILVMDKTRVWLIARSDFMVDVSEDFAFDRDARAVRIRGRFAIAAPDVPKALRRLQVTPAGTRTGAHK
jgi:HK97 family phage major capsid protein